MEDGGTRRYGGGVKQQSKGKGNATNYEKPNQETSLLGNDQK